MKIGPKFKIGKRLGASVFEKCQTQKFALSEARSGRTNKGRRGNKSDYAKQFLEKQKVRYTYGVMEKQFKNYVNRANSIQSGKPTENLYRLLEERLDNVVYRLGLATTRRGARQMVSHGHIVVNGQKVTIPSREVHVNEVIKIREGSKNSPLFLNLIDRMKDHTAPTWLTFDVQKGEGIIKNRPVLEKIGLAFDLSLVMEFYSR